MGTDMLLESHLEALPPELLLPVLHRLPDVESLSNLLRASPAAFRLFDLHGAGIFESVLTSDTAREYTCALIRIAGLVRCSSLPPQVVDWTSFQNFVRHETTCHRYSKPLWTLGPSKLPPGTPATALCGLLATHRRLTCLTISCIKFYFERFKALRPLHPVDKTFSYISDYYGPDNHYIPSWQQTPAGEPFPIRDPGPPTWIEEQLVLRAFWRVQLFEDLKHAVNTSRISLPGIDLDRLNDVGKPYGTAMVGFHGLYSVPASGLMDQDYEEPMITQQDTLLEHELIWSVVEYVKEDRETIMAPNFLETTRDWPTPTPNGQVHLDSLNDYTSSTHKFFYAVNGGASEGRSYSLVPLGNYEITGRCSPIQHVPFAPFRRFGFAIWDEIRMFGHGFLNPDRLLYHNDSGLMAWRSILGKDEIAAVERWNQEQYELALKDASDYAGSDDETE